MGQPLIINVSHLMSVSWTVRLSVLKAAKLHYHAPIRALIVEWMYRLCMCLFPCSNSVRTGVTVWAFLKQSSFQHVLYNKCRCYYIYISFIFIIIYSCIYTYIYMKLFMSYWKFNFPMNPDVRLFFGWSVSPYKKNVVLFQSIVCSVHWLTD